MRLTLDVYIQCNAPGCRTVVPQYTDEPRQDKCEEHRSQEHSNREHANRKRSRRHEKEER